MLWARISGTDLVIYESRSPLAAVVETVPFGSRAAAEKALATFLKQQGKTFGGKYK